jgi:hypothetical protein
VCLAMISGVGVPHLFQNPAFRVRSSNSSATPSK